MLTRYLIATVATIALFTATPAVAQSADPHPSVIDSIFAAYDHTSTPGCAVGVYRKEQIVFERGYGMADLNQSVPISPLTAFYIGSTSKQFAAISVALLDEAGKLTLDDPIRKWLPELGASTDRITVRHLIHHQSGIRDYLGLWSISGRSYADEIPPAMALDLIARQRALDFTPGSKYSYSNSGYFLLSEIVKRASGQTLRAFADSAMFIPLGMRNTHFHDDNSMIVPRRAEGYQANGRGGFDIVRTSYALVGDGGLYTTLEDLRRWDANFYHNQLGRRGQDLVTQITTAAPLGDGSPGTYAFGLFPATHQGLPMISHGGAFIGFRAELVRFPTQRLSVAVLCNENSAPAEQLALQVADRYLADQLAPTTTVGAEGPATVTVPTERLRRLAGRYEVLPGMVLEVSVDRNDLLFNGLGVSAKAVAHSDSTFTVGPLGRIDFVTTATGPAIVARAVGNDAAPRLSEVPPLTPATLASYVGRFTSDELDTWAVFDTVGDTLRMQLRWSEPLTLVQTAPDVFTRPQMGRIHFDRGPGGAIIGFRMSAGRIQNVIFTR